MRTNESRAARRPRGERKLLALALAGWLGALAVSAPAVASAQAGSADAAMTDEARKLYDEAKKAKDKGDHATCVAKLRAAWALKRHRQVAGLLGECELRAGAGREAAEHLAYFLDNAGDAPAAAVSAVRAMYDEARAEIAVVTVKASAPDADRKVDGRPMAPEDTRVFLAPGEHVFAATRAGVGSGEKKIFVSGGQEREVLIELAPDAGAAPPPAVAAPLDRPPAQPPVETTDGPSIVPGLVVGGIGLVGVGVGVALLVAAGGAGSDAETIAAGINGRGGECQPVTPGFEEPCQAFQDEVSRQDSLNLGAGIALVSGAVLVAGGAAWTIWAATSDGETVESGGGGGARAVRARHVTVSPALGWGGGALRLHGAF